MLRTNNLTKFYSRQEKPVLEQLDLTVSKGEFVIIMGNSGSGKSTLLYLLSGLDLPSSGQVWLNKEALENKSEKQLALIRRAEIGYVFQDHYLIHNLSVLENVMLPALWGKSNKKVIQARAIQLLDLMGIANLSHRLPMEISGGEKQRCTVARALINQPSILLADEPTGNLHAQATQSLLDLFSQLHEQGQTIVMVTHNVQTALRGSRIMYLKDGQIKDSLSFDSKMIEQEKRALINTWLHSQGW